MFQLIDLLLRTLLTYLLISSKHNDILTRLLAITFTINLIAKVIEGNGNVYLIDRIRK